MNDFEEQPNFDNSENIKLSKIGLSLTMKCFAEILINIELVKVGVYPKLIIDMETTEEYLLYKKFAEAFMKKNFG